MGVGGGDAGCVGGAGAAAVLCQVEGVVGEEVIVGDGRGLVCESGNNVQAFGVDVRVLFVRRGPVEAACAEAVELHLV